MENGFDWREYIAREEGFTCITCKRYFSSHYFDTGPGSGDYKDREEHGGEYYYCAYCDRKGGNNPKNPFYWDDRRIPWPYPEDLKSIP